MATSLFPSYPPNAAREEHPRPWSLLPTVHRRETRPAGIGVIFALLAVLTALILPIMVSLGH